MSKSIYKAEYVCDCGVNYGSCGAKCAVILMQCSITDVYFLFHTDGHLKEENNNMPVTKKGGLNCFEEEYLSALLKVIEMTEDNYYTLTKQEIQFIFNDAFNYKEEERPVSPLSELEPDAKRGIL